ncbi:hypothetical protein C2U70_08640 [Bradyrhizobium guangdongense]|nr:hypothetical protein C2U70_08640 [Bradyrhizobium guangdongense]
MRTGGQDPLPQGGVAARARNHESSQNYSLWLWVPDLRALRARLSGTTMGDSSALIQNSHPTPDKLSWPARLQLFAAHHMMIVML